MWLKVGCSIAVLMCKESGKTLWAFLAKSWKFNATLVSAK